MQELLINKVIENVLKNSKEDMDGLTQRFTSISASSFSNSLSAKNKKTLIIKMFEYIVNKRCQKTDISIIGNKQF
jgi:hypothetical protein